MYKTISYEDQILQNPDEIAMAEGAMTAMKEGYYSIKSQRQRGTMIHGSSGIMYEKNL